MAKTIIFKKEFEDKLKKLKIKTKFLKNLKNGKGCLQRRYFSGQERIEEINTRVSWWGFVNGMAIWESTPEGHNYWENIARS
jgi:hypothetical protein